jgi:hypothetical protein
MVREGLLDRHRRFGTINCDGVSAKGELCGVTTTSGLAFKIPGRVGDSPILGAGLWVDNEIGAAGSTGRGEANLYNLSSRMIVEELRRGRSAKDAGMETLRRVTAATVEKRLLDKNGVPRSSSLLRAHEEGEYAGVAMWGLDEGKPERFAVCTESGPSCSRWSRSTRERPRSERDAGRSGRAAALHRTLLHDVRLHFTVFLSLFQLLPTAPFGSSTSAARRRSPGSSSGCSPTPRRSRPDHGCPRRPHRQAPHAARDERRDLRFLARLRREPQLLGAARAAFFHGLFWSGLLSASSAYMTEVIPESRRAEGIGYWGMATMLATAVSPGVGLWMYGHGWAWLCLGTAF